MVLKLNKQLRYPKLHIAKTETNHVGASLVAAHETKTYINPKLNGDPPNINTYQNKTKEKIKLFETDGVTMNSTQKRINKFNIRTIFCIAMLVLCLFVSPTVANNVMQAKTVESISDIELPSEISLRVGEEKEIDLTYNGVAKNITIEMTTEDVVEVEERIKSVKGLNIGTTKLIIKKVW